MPPTRRVYKYLAFFLGVSSGSPAPRTLLTPPFSPHAAAETQFQGTGECRATGHSASRGCHNHFTAHPSSWPPWRGHQDRATPRRGHQDKAMRQGHPAGGTLKPQVCRHSRLSRDSRGNRVTKRDSAAFESTRNAETPRLPRVVEKRAPEAPNRVKSARVTGHSAPWCRPGDQGGLWGERSSLYLSSTEPLNSQGPRQPCPAGHAQRASLSAAVASGTRTRHSHSPWGHRCHLSAGRRLRRSQAARAPAAVYPP